MPRAVVPRCVTPHLVLRAAWQEAALPHLLPAPSSLLALLPLLAYLVTPNLLQLEELEVLSNLQPPSNSHQHHHLRWQDQQQLVLPRVLQQLVPCSSNNSLP